MDLEAASSSAAQAQPMLEPGQGLLSSDNNKNSNDNNNNNNSNSNDNNKHKTIEFGQHLDAAPEPLQPEKAASAAAVPEVAAEPVGPQSSSGEHDDGEGSISEGKVVVLEGNDEGESCPEADVLTAPARKGGDWATGGVAAAVEAASSSMATTAAAGAAEAAPATTAATSATSTAAAPPAPPLATAAAAAAAAAEPTTTTTAATTTTASLAGTNAPTTAAATTAAAAEFNLATLAAGATLTRASSVEDEDDDEPVCRICRDGVESGKLYCPCRCSGSIKYIHESCLKTWLFGSSAERRPVCELCHHPFTFTPVYAEDAPPDLTPGDWLSWLATATMDWCFRGLRVVYAILLWCFVLPLLTVAGNRFMFLGQANLPAGAHKHAITLLLNIFLGEYFCLAGVSMLYLVSLIRPPSSWGPAPPTSGSASGVMISVQLQQQQPQGQQHAEHQQQQQQHQEQQAPPESSAAHADAERRGLTAFFSFRPAHSNRPSATSGAAPVHPPSAMADDSSDAANTRNGGFSRILLFGVADEAPEGESRQGSRRDSQQQEEDRRLWNERLQSVDLQTLDLQAFLEENRSTSVGALLEALGVSAQQSSGAANPNPNPNFQPPPDQPELPAGRDEVQARALLDSLHDAGGPGWLRSAAARTAAPRAADGAGATARATTATSADPPSISETAPGSGSAARTTSGVFDDDAHESSDCRASPAAEDGKHEEAEVYSNGSESILEAEAVSTDDLAHPGKHKANNGQGVGNHSEGIDGHSASKTSPDSDERQAPDLAWKSSEHPLEAHATTEVDAPVGVTGPATADGKSSFEVCAIEPSQILTDNVAAKERVNEGEEAKAAGEMCYQDEKESEEATRTCDLDPERSASPSVAAASAATLSGVDPNASDSALEDEAPAETGEDEEGRPVEAAQIATQPSAPPDQESQPSSSTAAEATTATAAPAEFSEAAQATSSTAEPESDPVVEQSTAHYVPASTFNLFPDGIPAPTQAREPSDGFPAARPPEVGGDGRNTNLPATDEELEEDLWTIVGLQGNPLRALFSMMIIFIANMVGVFLFLRLPLCVGRQSMNNLVLPWLQVHSPAEFDESPHNRSWSEVMSPVPPLILGTLDMSSTSALDELDLEAFSSPGTITNTSSSVVEVDAEGLISSVVDANDAWLKEEGQQAHSAQERFEDRADVPPRSPDLHDMEKSNTVNTAAVATTSAADEQENKLEEQAAQEHGQEDEEQQQEEREGKADDSAEKDQSEESASEPSPSTSKSGKVDPAKGSSSWSTFLPTKELPPVGDMPSLDLVLIVVGYCCLTCYTLCFLLVCKGVAQLVGRSSSNGDVLSSTLTMLLMSLLRLVEEGASKVKLGLLSFLQKVALPATIGHGIVVFLCGPVFHISQHERAEICSTHSAMSFVVNLLLGYIHLWAVAFVEGCVASVLTPSLSRRFSGNFFTAALFTHRYIFTLPSVMDMTSSGSGSSEGGNNPHPGVQLEFILAGVDEGEPAPPPPPRRSRGGQQGRRSSQDESSAADADAASSSLDQDGEVEVLEGDDDDHHHRAPQGRGLTMGFSRTTLILLTAIWHGVVHIPLSFVVWFFPALALNCACGEALFPLRLGDHSGVWGAGLASGSGPGAMAARARIEASRRELLLSAGLAPSTNASSAAGTGPLEGQAVFTMEMLQLTFVVLQCAYLLTTSSSLTRLVTAACRGTFLRAGLLVTPEAAASAAETPVVDQPASAPEGAAGAAAAAHAATTTAATTAEAHREGAEDGAEATLPEPESAATATTSSSSPSFPAEDPAQAQAEEKVPAAAAAALGDGDGSSGGGLGSHLKEQNDDDDILQQRSPEELEAKGAETAAHNDEEGEENEEEQQQQQQQQQQHQQQQEKHEGKEAEAADPAPAPQLEAKDEGTNESQREALATAAEATKPQEREKEEAEEGKERDGATQEAEEQEEEHLTPHSVSNLPRGEVEEASKAEALKPDVPIVPLQEPPDGAAGAHDAEREEAPTLGREVAPPVPESEHPPSSEGPESAQGAIQLRFSLFTRESGSWQQVPPTAELLQHAIQELRSNSSQAGASRSLANQLEAAQVQARARAAIRRQERRQERSSHRRRHRGAESTRRTNTVEEDACPTGLLQKFSLVFATFLVIAWGVMMFVLAVPLVVGRLSMKILLASQAPRISDLLPLSVGVVFVSFTVVLSIKTAEALPTICRRLANMENRRILHLVACSCSMTWGLSAFCILIPFGVGSLLLKLAMPLRVHSVFQVPILFAVTDSWTLGVVLAKMVWRVVQSDLAFHETHLLFTSIWMEADYSFTNLFFDLRAHSRIWRSILSPLLQEIAVHLLFPEAFALTVIPFLPEEWHRTRAAILMYCYHCLLSVRVVGLGLPWLSDRLSEARQSIFDAKYLVSRELQNYHPMPAST